MEAREQQLDDSARHLDDRSTAPVIKRSARTRHIRDTLLAILLVEVVALVIALIMPLTPSKTGSRRGISTLLFDTESYLAEVIVGFVLANLIIGVILLAAVVLAKFQGGADDKRGRREE